MITFDIAFHRAQLAIFNNDQLTRLNVTNKGCTQCIQRTGLRCNHIGMHQLADAQRAESVRITRRNQLARRHDDEGICALNLTHRIEHCLLNAAALETLTHDGVCQHLSITGGTENAAGQLYLSAQLARVDKISVVCDGQIALAVGNAYRLCVFTRRMTGCGVTDMSYRNGARHAVQNLLIKHFVDQSDVLMTLDDAVVVDGDAACLLSSVLQCKQSGVGIMCRTDLANIFFVDVNAKHAAFFMQLCLSVKRRTGHFSHSILHKILHSKAKRWILCCKLAATDAFQPVQNFLISLYGIAQIAAKAVFSQLSAGLGIPQAAGIRRDFICQHNRAVRQTAKFQLAVDQANSRLKQLLL